MGTGQLSTHQRDAGAHTPHVAEAPFAGPGEMRARCRARDWGATPLGPVAAWPTSLRTIAAVVLAAPTPMIVLWGPQHVQLYNDGYRAIMGAKHPDGLGQPNRECWPEVWDFNAPIFESVRERGESLTFTDQRLLLARDGAPAEGFFTLTFSPVPDDAGGIGGVLATVFETTAQVRARDARAAEHERLLAASEASRARMTATLESIADAFYAIDADFRFTYVNRRAEELWGRSRDTLVGRHFWTEFPETVGSEAHQMLHRAMAERRPLHFEARSPIFGRWVEVSLYPQVAGDGLACYFRDIEERKVAEAAVRESERRLRAIFDGTYEYIGLLAPDGTLLETNRASLAFAGGTRDDVVGRPFWETVWFAHTPGAPAHVRDAVARAAAGEFVRWEAPIRRPSGEWSTFDVSLHPVRDERGAVVLIVPEGRDVTERHRTEAALAASEARFRALFASMDEGFCILEILLDDDGRPQDYRYVEVNESFTRHTGMADALGRTIRELVPDIEPFWIATYGRVALTGEPVRAESHAAGLGRWFDVNAFRIGAPHERRVAVLFNDITGRKRADAERERLLGESERAREEAEAARREAEAANRGKSEFLAVMSHELRTPLNAIGGYAELIELGLRGPVTEAQRADLARIQQSQRHLLGLINQVLNYTRVDAGAVRYDVADVPVVEALAAAEALVLPQVRARGLAYALGGCAPDLTVRADREKLQQILLNLLSNAIKFTEPGGEVRVTCTPRDDGTVAIAVRDTGIGIAPDKLASIFEPFVQVDQRLTRPHEGVGLGLAISRDLARGMGGDLAAESAPGEGTVLTLTVPRAAT
jgi:PAS domain S-box-containing protein